MMKILNHLIAGFFIVSTALSPSISFGDAVTVKPETPTATQPSGSLSSGTAVNDSANKAKDSNSNGQMMSMLVGAGLTATGISLISSSNPGTVAAGYALLGLAALSFLQSGQHGKSAGQAGTTSNLSDGYDDLYDTGGGLVDPTIKKDAEKAMQQLENAGYNPKTGTITTSTGKTYGASDFSSKESMVAAGFPSGMVDGALAYAEKLSKNAESKVSKIKLGAMTEANGFADGGGGGGGAGGAPGAAVDPYAAAMAGMGGAGSGAGTGATDRDPSSLAGMQKNYNGEPIGVSADSIFLMMTRRYKVKESQESFYSDSDIALKK